MYVLLSVPTNEYIPITTSSSSFVPLFINIPTSLRFCPSLNSCLLKKKLRNEVNLIKLNYFSYEKLYCSVPISFVELKSLTNKSLLISSSAKVTLNKSMQIIKKLLNISEIFFFRLINLLLLRAIK